VPSSAAEHGVFPKIFGKFNKKGAPVFALTATSIIMQITLMFSAFEKNAFLAIISISGSMILIPYVLSALFLAKLAYKNKKNNTGHEKLKTKALFVGITASIYGFWLLYAAGFKYILLSTILYAIGIIAYRLAWPFERIIAIVIVIFAVISVFVMIYEVLPK